MGGSRGDGSAPPAGRIYHGTRDDLRPGDLVARGRSGSIYVSRDLDAAIRNAELATDDAPPRVYVVDTDGASEFVAGPPLDVVAIAGRGENQIRGHGMTHYHGTRAVLRPGDLLVPGNDPNFGRTLSHVYLARTLDAAMWAAELALGEGPERIYVVEPTGPIEDDPNVTDKRFRGDPTRSFRSRHPLRVTGELARWTGHSKDAIAAMKVALETLKHQGVVLIDD